MRIVSLLTICLLSFPLVSARADEESIELKDVPKPVIESVKKRFPKGEVTEAAKEEADGKTVYEVSVKVDGKNVDITLSPDGAIQMIEKEIATKDLPKAVTEGVAKKYPKAKYKLAEEVTVVESGKEKLGYYEVRIVSADGKTLEIELAPDGKIKHEEDISEEEDAEKK